MKKIVSGLILVLFLSVSGFAQKQKTSPDTEQEIKPSKKNSKKSEQNGGVLLESGTSIEAQLQQTLDVQKASVGDKVVLTTTKALKQNGQTVVQKGARLVGRVTEVQQKTKENAQSKIGVIFDRIEGKNLSSPISASIVSITRASANTAVGDTLNTDLSGSSSSSGGVSRTSSGGGGGLLGGVTNTVGSVVNTTTETVGGVTNTAGQTIGGTTQSLGRTLNGVRLSQSSDASANGSTMLSSSDKNLRIEKGVTFQLRLTQAVEN
jgi:phenylpyruvate tautomerase PptA (4-oxalocrotonate tautomerase family)